MKKIPKFDQKAWDEKQAKSVENYSKNDGGFPSLSYVDALKKLYPESFIQPASRKDRMADALDYLKNFNNKTMDKALEDALIQGSGYMPILKVPKDKLAAQYPPIIYGADPALAPSSTVKSSYNSTTGVWTLGDDYDQKIFGGDSEDTQLPAGYDYLGQGWIKPDPAFEKACCQPEDKVNIGFHMDKWACKRCGKDMP